MKIIDSGSDVTSLWLWIGICGAAVIVLGILFILNLRRYVYLCRRVRARKNSANPGAVQDRGADFVTDMYSSDNRAETERTLPDAGLNFAAAQTTLRTAALVSEKKEQKNPGIYVGKIHNIGRRSSQQDSFGISQDGTRINYSGKGIFALVADGMGGLENGGQVSAMVTMTMMREFDRLSRNYSGEQALLSMLGEANDQVNALIQSSGSKKSGSTVVAVIIRDMKLYWITVGDSHIYLYRSGALMQVNRDHVYSVVLDEMAARGEISHQEAAQNPQRNALTSYIGMGKLEKIDRNIRPMQLQSGDRVLLMSDGVFGTLSEEEITAAMKFSAAESAEAMDQMIRRKNLPAQDNYTALILECV